MPINTSTDCSASLTCYSCGHIATESAIMDYLTSNNKKETPDCMNCGIKWDSFFVQKYMDIPTIQNVLNLSDKQMDVFGIDPVHISERKVSTCYYCMKETKLIVPCHNCDHEICEKCYAEKNRIIHRRRGTKMCHCLKCDAHLDKVFMYKHLSKHTYRQYYRFFEMNDMSHDDELLIDMSYDYIDQFTELNNLKKGFLNPCIDNPRFGLKHKIIRINVLKSELKGEETIHESYVAKCGKKDCDGYVDSSKLKCNKCYAYACYKCYGLFDFEHVCKPEDLERDQLLSNDFKKCPTCQKCVFKIHGCGEDMFCISCKTAFDASSMTVQESGNSNPHYVEWSHSKDNQVTEKSFTSKLREKFSTSDAAIILNKGEREFVDHFFRANENFYLNDLPTFYKENDFNRRNTLLYVKFVCKYISCDYMTHEIYHRYMMNQYNRDINELAKEVEAFETRFVDAFINEPSILKRYQYFAHIPLFMSHFMERKCEICDAYFKK